MPENLPTARLATTAVSGTSLDTTPVPGVAYVPASDSLNANLEHFFPFILLAHVVARMMPYDMFNRRRAWVYRTCGFTGIGRDVLILGPLRIVGTRPVYSSLTIGEASAIATPCTLSLYAPIAIGKRVHFGPEVMVLTGTHQIGESDERCGPYNFEPVSIGDGTWVGARVTILPGVTIGAGCVITAGSVVTRDMPDDMLVAGNPARPIRRLQTVAKEAQDAVLFLGALKQDIDE